MDLKVVAQTSPTKRIKKETQTQQETTPNKNQEER
jgi:hypothetical protein